MSIEAMKLALEALEDYKEGTFAKQNRVGAFRTCCGTPELTRPHASDCRAIKAITALRQSIEQAEQAQPVSIKDVAKKSGIHMPVNYIATMADAVAAGDSVLMNEQAALLRECRSALDSLIAQKPTLAGLLCGSTTLGNLKAELGAYRPQGVFGTAPPSNSMNSIKSDKTSDAPLQHEQAQKQEPVAWYFKGLTNRGVSLIKENDGWIPLYTTPQPQRTWVGLTDDEILAIGQELGLKCKLAGNPNIDFDYARAIEAKLKDKNT